MADYNKLSQQLDRRMEALDRRLAANSGRKPLEDVGRFYYIAEIPYECDTILQGKVIKVFNRFTGWYKKEGFIDMFGPFVLFKVEDVLKGDDLGKIDIGAIILGKWNNSDKSYHPYLYKGEPTTWDDELLNVANFLTLSVEDIIKA